MTFANSCLKLNLDETMSQVLTEEIRRKSMGITINESEEVHNSTELIDRFNHLRKQAREPAETRVDRDIGKTDNGRSRGIVNQVFSTLIAERLVRMFPTIGQSRGTKTVDDSSGIRDDPTRTVLPKTTKSMFLTLDLEKFSH